MQQDFFTVWISSLHGRRETEGRDNTSATFLVWERSNGRSAYELLPHYTYYMHHLALMVTPDITHALLVHLIGDEFESDSFLSPLLDGNIVQLAYFSH